MTDDTAKPSLRKRGEKQPGKYHFNPGNMSGKTADAGKDEADQNNNVDRIKSRHEHTKERK